MEEIRNNVILDLKRRAKQSKEENDTDEALQWLKQAKVIEESNGDLLPQQLKKLAVYYKQHNDIEAAKDSLIKSKQIEQCSLQQQQSDALKDPTNENDKNGNMEDGGDDDDEALLQLNDEGDGDAANIEFTDEEMIDKEMIVEFQSCSMPVPSQELYDQRILHHKKLALAWKQKNDIPKATSALRFAKQLQAVQMALQSNSGGGGGGGGGGGTDDLDDWMKSLTAEESDLLGELMNDNNMDNEMMEMMIDGAENSEDDVGQQQSPSNMKFDLKDIETMDDDDILECLKMGMILPSVDAIQDQATQKQKEAINCKKSGDLESAKSKLAESKKIKSQAERLDRIFKSYNNNNNKNGEVNDDDLEALLTSSSSSTKKKQQNQQQEASSAPPPPPQNPWLNKPSAEIKAEVIKLKNEKKVTEATKLLQIYKEVVKKENEAKEKAKCQQLITSLEKQIEFAEEQIKLFCFYERFDDDTSSSIGSEQLRLWKLYIKGCQQVIERISTYGSNSIEISKATTNKLKVVNDDIDIVGLVERVSGSGNNNNTNLDGNLEVSIIEVMNIQDNKPYQKFLSKLTKNKNNNESQASSTSSRTPIMEVDVKLQLPLNEDSQHVHMMFHPTTAATTTNTQQETSATEESSATANHQFLFDKSHIVKIPRGDTRQAKTILKRVETKKVQVNISVKPPPPPQEKKSWFFSSSSKGGADGSSSEVGGAHLGKIVLDLKDLLSRNCIAGDFQITVNSKEVGGSVRLCIRTDRPFDIHQFEGYVGSRRDDDSNNTNHNADQEEQQQQLLVPYSNCLSFSEVTSTTTTK